MSAIRFNDGLDAAASDNSRMRQPERAVDGSIRNVMPMKIMLKKLRQLAGKPLEWKLEKFQSQFYNLENKLFAYSHSFDFEGFIPRDELVAESAFSLANANNFNPYSKFLFKRLLQEAISTGIEFENFVDVGCGKGQQCFYAAKYFKFKKVIGIDFSDPLIQVARQNLSKTRYRNIYFFTADATCWEIPNGTSIVFMFNPFNEVIFRQFLLLNLKHFREYQSLIAYGFDSHRKVMQEFGFEIVFRSHRHQHSLMKFAGALKKE
jgi:SAM-dependent methyltransferase